MSLETRPGLGAPTGPDSLPGTAPEAPTEGSPRPCPDAVAEAPARPLDLAPAGPSCHSDGGGPPAPTGSPVIALAGAPNGGKSTLFNALTGARRSVGNYPGTSVEIGRGAWRTSYGTFDLIDLPGSYSLDPSSPDEALTRQLLIDAPEGERPDVVVLTVDASHLARSLYLAAQVRELPLRVVVVLTMSDVAARRGAAVDLEALGNELGCPVIAVDPRRRANIERVAAAVQSALQQPLPPVREHPEHLDDFELADERFGWVDAVSQRTVSRSAASRRTWSDRIDALALSPVGGPILFAAVMWAVFQVTTTVASPLQDALGNFFTGPVSDAATSLLQALHLDNAVVHGLVVNGLIAGVGMLLTFVPLMTLMFALMSLLEDSGYMARAAVVADRLMRRLGLPGRAFLPLIVGFGCNVPAIAATRVLSGARQRLLTALLVPFTSCSARLTVYVMLAATFFPDRAGTVVFAMYLTSIVLVVVVGLVLRSTLWRTMGSEALMLDLPPYQRPTLRVMLSVTWTRVKGFLKTASGIIVATVCIVWLLQATPVTGDGTFGDVPTEHSAYGVVAQTIAPVFDPAGFGAWQTTGALVTGFVAKEAVISSWAQTYAIDSSTDAGTSSLGEAIRGSFEQSSGGHPIPAVLAFMVFLLAYTPCVATLAAQRREIGLRWTVFGVGMQLVTAWVLAVIVFQVARIWL